jgi:hypothetical protein
MNRTRIGSRRLGSCLAVTAAATAALILVSPSAGAPRAELAKVVLRSPVIDLYHSASISVSGVTGDRAEVRLLGAIDRRGLAYEWTPYPWRRLRLQDGKLHGVLPAPALVGIYRLQLRVEGSRRFLSSSRWLLRVFPRGTARRASPTPAAAVRAFVARLPGDQVLVALRRWPRASFDHRDPRLNRLFVIAYAPRGDQRRSSRLGLFITTVRDGFHGRWRVLAATTQPYD